MKKIITILSLFAVVLSCKEKVKKEENNVIVDKEPIAVTEVMEDGVIYEANIRQYSPEGTFNAFTKDIPVLKKLGVKVIWVMPINPISKVKRKATDGQFTSDIKDEEERKKYLGSYYSVSDYKAINPEFGTLDDFKNMVTTAHDNGILVIVDWVPNHTGWDHPWIAEHPEYYTQNEQGEIIDPINPETGESWGWTDVADLNYDNDEMRKEMISDMKFWVEKADIDGFRMDVAHKVPVDFFNTAIKEMKTVKPVFMLAEAEQPDLLQNGFDMQYGWEVHHIFNEIAKGEANVTKFDEYMVKLDTILEADDINMNFVTNHDENSWNGTLLERMPNNKEVFTALTYVMPGMPLIYSGQEYDMEHRLRFFEKDTIPKTKGKYFTLLEKLGELKNTNTALNGGKKAANYTRVNTSNNEAILAFKRDKDGETVYFIANLSNTIKEATISLNGEFTDYISNNTFTIEENTALKLAPWEYHILITKK
ncbi:alpha-amylase family glycosyl hydrolase [Cellulophaga omnivescoria]|uniref:alpha-amylase family glycosyl hydrolase n=1 Tax=Cellulophaga omnivescoria TaxID=1888890 RepID=UPI0009847897|nr:alpha-amylase family glycosyl hydrolase [Cellulophaga omnivescoria]WBU88620.1 alpha-amylase family glycosyl hydrolase [Cellulophaga omnivescoria]